MTTVNSAWLGLNRNYHPPGTAPGTLVDYRCENTKALSIKMIVYNADAIREYTLSSITEAWQYEEPGLLTWLHLDGCAKPALLQELGQHFALHPLSLEDVMNEGQHSKLEEYPGYHFLTAYLLTEKVKVSAHQLSIFVGSDYVITFISEGEKAFDLIEKRLQNPQSALRKQGVDYLVYSLLDTMIDAFFPRLEDINDQLIVLEDRVFRASSQDLIERVHNLKIELLFLGNLVWELQELVGALQNEDSDFISEHSSLYLRDCFDHTEQLLRVIDSSRAIANGLTDTYLSLSNNQMSQVMKVLTLIATIFIPLTFIVGVYGMNFNTHAGPLSMPELNWAYGYVGIWALMIALALAMLIVFKQRKWL